MPSILARDNRHLFLERNENKGNSFVANINILVNDLDNIDTLTSDIENVNLVANNISNINTLVTNLDHITAVEAAIPQITIVSENIKNINLVGQNISDIINVAINIPTFRAIEQELPVIRELYSQNIPKLAQEIDENRISIENTSNTFYTKSTQAFEKFNQEYDKIVEYYTSSFVNLKNEHDTAVKDVNTAKTTALTNIETKRVDSLHDLDEKHTTAVDDITSHKSEALNAIELKRTDVLKNIDTVKERTIETLDGISTSLITKHDQIKTKTINELEDASIAVIDRAHLVKTEVLSDLNTNTTKYVKQLQNEGDTQVERIEYQADVSIQEIGEFTAGIAESAVDVIKEAGTTEQDRLRITVDSAIEQAENEAIRAEVASSRVENVLAYAYGSAQTASIVLNETIHSGDTIDLSVSYIVGSNTLLLSWGGERLYLGLAYEEVGELGESSHQVKILIDIMKGYVLNAWVSPSIAYGNVDAVEQRIIDATDHVQELGAETARNVEIFDARIAAIDSHTEEGILALDDELEKNKAILATDAKGYVNEAKGYAVKSRGYSETSASEADRAERAADFTVVLSKGKAINQSWVLNEQLKIDDELELPVSYMVGQNTLRLSYGGLELYKDINYEEIGEENTLSNKVKIKFNVLRGYVFNAWIAPTTKSGDIDAIDAKVEETIDKVNALGLSADEYLAKANEYANMIQGKLDSSIDTLNIKTNVLKGDLSTFTNARKDDINSYTQEQLEELSVYAEKAEQEALSSENYSNVSKTHSEAAKVSEDNALESANKAENAYNNTVALVKGKANDATWEIDENLSANTVITLPISYPVGLNLLQLSYGGFLLFKGKDYEEVGEEDSQSNQVKILFEIEENSVFHAWTSPIVKTVDLEAIEERLDTTLNKVNELGDLSQLDAKIDEVLITIADFNSEQYVELANNLMEELNGVVEEGSQILDNKIRNGKNEVTNYVNSAKNDVNEIVNESLADIVKYRNKAEQAANLAVKKAEYFKAKNEYKFWITEDIISANETITIPIQYIVGWNNLLVFVNGLLLSLNIDYLEVGNEDELSNSIVFLNEYNSGVKITVIGLYSSVKEELIDTNNRLDQLENTVNNLNETESGSSSSSGTGINVVPEGTNLEDDSIGDGLYIVDSDDDNP